MKLVNLTQSLDWYEVLYDILLHNWGDDLASPFWPFRFLLDVISVEIIL